MKKYHFMSLTTGEIASNLLDVLRIALRDVLIAPRVLHKWKYSREGF